MAVAVLDEDAGPPPGLRGERIRAGGGAYDSNCVSMDNPHCVILLPDISRETAGRIGLFDKTHPLSREDLT